MTRTAERVGCPKNLGEWWLLCQVVFLHLILRVLIPRIRLDRLLRWLTPKRVDADEGGLAFETLDRFSNGLFRRFPSHPRGDCLLRSLVRFFFAQRHGFPVQFHCGVRRVGEVLDGHAWLSLEGKPFKEGSDFYQNFTLTFTYPHTLGSYADIEDAGEPLETYSIEPAAEQQRSQ